MKKILAATVLGGALLGGSLLGIGSAHADDQSYLAYLSSHGMDIQAFPGPGGLVMVGHIVCTNIQNGADPMMGMSFIERGTYGPPAVDAARHELCSGR
jgi:hypothetical protein